MLNICLFIIGLIPEEGLSASYYKKFGRSIPERLGACIDLYRLAEREGADPLLVLSVASMESGFMRKQISKAGARGLLGVMPSNMRSQPCWTSKRNKCAWGDYILRGVEILSEMDVESKSICDDLAQYNAGNKGRCAGVGGSYARMVLYRHSLMQNVPTGGTCESC